MRITIAILAVAGLLAGLFGRPATAVSVGTALTLPGGVDAPGNQLPEQQGWRTFAKPLAIDTSGMLLFQRSGEHAVIWRIDWSSHKVSSLPVPEIKLQKDRRYTALISRDGLWLLGDTTLLIRPDGRRLQLDTRFNEPVAVVLDDQSLLVLGPSLHGAGNDVPYQMQQLSLVPTFGRLQLTDRGLLSYDGRPNETGQRYRLPRYGHGAVKLDDGRVLLFGGDVTPTLASVIEPRPGSGSWTARPLPPMPNERVFGVAQRLPDGRIAITGAPHLRCYGEAEKARSVDVLDPRSGQWSKLPPLPFVPCADAYGADAPSIALTPNGSILIGAHLEPQVMMLPRDAVAPTGYASDWQIHGRMPLRRISGVLQALSDREVVVAGGVDNQEGNFGGCCYATAGVDRIDIAPGERNESLAMGFIGAGVARRGQLVFAGGGRRFGFTGSGQMRYSAHAELIDLARGTTRQLPNMPFASGAVKAVWLDDSRVLVKGRRQANDRAFELNGNLASYIPPSSADMAIFNLADNRWTTPVVPPQLEMAQLISGEGNSALLLSATMQLVRLDLVNGKVETSMQARRGRHGGEARLLPDGRLVLAGGEVQFETVSVVDPDCEAEERKECPEQFVGFGPYSREAMVEILKPGKHAGGPVPANESSTLSEVGPSAVLSTVITAAGQTIVLAQDEQTKQTAVARTSADGKSWETLPLPPELPNDGDGRCGRCALALSADPRDKTKELLFFRQGAIDFDYVDDRIGAQSVIVWWWDEPARSWRQVLHVDGSSARGRPLALTEPLSQKSGKRMMSMGWHLRDPVLWIVP